MWKNLINLIFPTRCVACESYNTQADICSDCWSKLTFITKPYCNLCSLPFAYEDDQDTICGHCIKQKPQYDKAIAILKYNPDSQKLIHSFKYRDQLHILNYLVNLMSNIGKDIIQEADIIIPVAMYKYKLLKRGYNQAALLAMKIASKNKIPYLPQVLIKKKNSIAQIGLTKEQRIKNIKNTFELNSKFIKQVQGKRILLIDDVITTGSTINECCKILRKASPSKIFVLTLAKRI
jgi:ComF family protein